MPVIPHPRDILAIKRHNLANTTTRQRLLIAGSVIALSVIITLVCTTVYANIFYPWPTQDEFKSEMVLIEKENPGFVYALMTVDTTSDTQRWATIHSIFNLVDWETWPWPNGAFYRQFNPPGWVVFCDTYEVVNIVLMLLSGYFACRLWNKAGVPSIRYPFPSPAHFA